MCCNCDTINDLIIESDKTVFKALSISEISQMAKIELRLRMYLENKWIVRKKQAISKASSMAGSNKSSNQISSTINKIMNQWSKDVIKTFNKEMREVYKLARIAGHKKATRQTKTSLQYNVPATTGDEKTIITKAASRLPDFDLVDEEAMDALDDRNIFWVGKHYDENLSKTIAKTAKETMIEAGHSPSQASKLMSERINKALTVFVTPRGFTGTAKQYFEGLVANAMTVGRSYGQMKSFADVGIQKYTIVNPGGSRICPVCEQLNGTTFETQQGLNQIALEYKAKKPEDIKSIHPWPRSKSIVANKSPKELSNIGLSLPPYHYRCRCTVDITDVSSYEDLTPLDFPIK